MEIHCEDVEWIQEGRYMGQGRLDPVNTETNIQAIPGCSTSALFPALTDAEAIKRIPMDQLPIHLHPFQQLSSHECRLLVDIGQVVVEGNTTVGNLEER